MWEQQHRGVCGAVHQWCGLLDHWSEEAEQRHWWVPYQHQMAEELLALGLGLLLVHIINIYHVYQDIRVLV